MVSDSISEVCLNAETLIEITLSGSEVNHPGANTPTPRQAIANNKVEIARNILVFFLNILLWTIKNVTIHNILNKKIILIIIHEKSHKEGLINWCISRIEILLWKKYIVKISSTNSKNMTERIILFIIFIKVFLITVLIATRPIRIRNTIKSLTKYHK